MPSPYSLINLVRPAVLLFILLSAVTGLLYPLLVTGIAQAAFPWQANGSLVTIDGRPALGESDAAGSRLIGQAYTSPQYFWSRLSSTMPHPYNAAASSGSNLGPTNPALRSLIQQRVAELQPDAARGKARVPVDLVTASASGLDPHISPAAAMYQVPRVAAARSMTAGEVQKLVQRYTEGRAMGIFGESRVNVLLLNLALDRQQLEEHR